MMPTPWLRLPLVCLAFSALVASCGGGADDASGEGRRRSPAEEGVTLGGRDGSLSTEVRDGGAAAPLDASEGEEPPDAGVESGDAGTGSEQADSGRPRRDAGASDAGGRCVSSEDCIPGAEACSQVFLVGSSVEPHCVPTNPGGAATGAACSDARACESNACLTDISGECSVVCEDAARDCPAGFACTGYAYQGNVTISFCARSCADDSSCTPNGNVCATQMFQRSSGAWAVDTVCQRPLGAGALGAACASGADCRTGLCLESTRFNACSSDVGCNAGESCVCPGGGAPPCAGGQAGACTAKVCSALCDEDTDCAAAGQPLTRCNAIALAVPSGAPTSVRACAPR